MRRIVWALAAPYIAPQRGLLKAKDLVGFERSRVLQVTVTLWQPSVIAGYSAMDVRSLATMQFDRLTDVDLQYGRTAGAEHLANRAAKLREIAQ